MYIEPTAINVCVLFSCIAHGGIVDCSAYITGRIVCRYRGMCVCRVCRWPDCLIPGSSRPHVPEFAALATQSRQQACGCMTFSACYCCMPDVGRCCCKGGGSDLIFCLILKGPNALTRMPPPGVHYMHMHVLPACLRCGSPQAYDHALA